MGTRKSRSEKIHWIKDKLSYSFNIDPEAHIDKGIFLSEFALDNASTKRTGEDILRDLEKVGSIDIREGKIYKGGVKNENKSA